MGMNGFWVFVIVEKYDGNVLEQFGEDHYGAATNSTSHRHAREPS